jgi:hypothetical protein
MRASVALMIALAAAPTVAGAQSAADGPVLGARAMRPTAAFKIWVPRGTLRLVAWDRDSIVIRGRVARPDVFFFGGDADGAKFGVENHEPDGATGDSRLVAYIPRRGTVSVKTVSASIDATGVGGWFYTVSGSMHLSGRAASIEAESMNGSLDLDVTTPWLRARTGDGHLLLRGAPEDVDVSTISGTLDIMATGVLRGLFGSVTGDVHYVGSPSPGGIIEFSNHSGAVELVLPRSASGVFALSSIVGPIDNAIAGARPIASSPHSMRISLGRGGSQVTVRTFKGAIRLRAQ